MSISKLPEITPDPVHLNEFIFKPYAEMTTEDYQTVGFKSGLEVHQQLLTARKLFCRCPAGRYSPVYHAEILRHMRPTLSELGEYDGTALMEFKTKKEIIYRIHRDTVCTYEMDDTPPFELNEEALENALEIALLYGCTMVDELHIARKQYLDGSIPTGFQRTTIVGVDGTIPFKDRTIHIVQLGLEEDACREVSDLGHRRIYLADRLGMPLIETVTAPEMRTPDEVAEVGEIIRRLVRTTGKVRTGIGAGRQDVNVSVESGTRIEIKGVPRIPNIPLLTYNEAMRQWNLLRLRAELRNRGITPNTFTTQTANVTRILRKTRFKVVADSIQQGAQVVAVSLNGFRDLLRWQTQTDTYFSREISDRVRVIACLTTLPNIIHSDSISENLTSAEWNAVKKAVGATESDTVVLVWGDQGDTDTAAREIIIRAREATIGIPSETRQALRDGTNGFERILPGPDRMYPDTDSPPRRVTQERIRNIRARLPKFYWEREQWYRTLNIPADTIRPLAVSKFTELFETAVKEWKLSPTIASIALIQYPKRIRRKRLPIANLTPDSIAEILQFVAQQQATPEAILPAFEQLAHNGSVDWKHFAKLSDHQFSEIISDAVRFGRQVREATPGAQFRASMRVAMNSLRGRVPGRIVAEKVKSALEGSRS